MTALENGASGFTFSVSDSTLSILKVIHKSRRLDNLALYPMVPYSFEYVRAATEIGTPGLVKKVAMQIAASRNLKAIAMGIRSVMTTNPAALLKTYLIYEISEVRLSAGKQADIKSVILNETITDMALGLNLDWLFKTYVEFLQEQKIRPGFNTRNLPSLVKKLGKLEIRSSQPIIATPFNRVGFQMNPSQSECEKILACCNEFEIMAISIFAAGYLKPAEAIDYIATLPNIKSVAVGISKEYHARETFKLLKEKLEG
jgi:hypothetical protein